MDNKFEGMINYENMVKYFNDVKAKEQIKNLPPPVEEEPPENSTNTQNTREVKLITMFFTLSQDFEKNP